MMVLFEKQIVWIKASNIRIAIVLFLVSLAVRVCFLLPVNIFDVALVYDETLYYSRAIAFRNIFVDLFQLHSPSSSDLYQAYGNGVWPPLHAIILSAGLFLFGEEPGAARIVVTLFSAMTTPLVYFLILKLATRRSALFAALIHIIYPSFIAYSHYLWSETTFIFLLLMAVYFTISICEERTSRKNMLRAALAGLFLGLSGLARVAASPFLLMVPLWLALTIKRRKHRILLPGVIIASWIITLLPWELTLAYRENRFVPISTRGGYNLYLGNNPWVPDGFGSSWNHVSKMRLVEPIREYAEINKVDMDTAARSLAFKYIKQDLTGFVIRCIYRLQMLWTSDYFIVRHILNTVYPPMHHSMVALLWSVVLASYMIFIGLASWGLWASPPLHKRGLMLALVLSGMIPSILTFGISRLHMPLLALLLPAAGHGAANIRQKTPSKPALATIATTLLFCFIVITSMPIVVSVYLVPSSYYSQLIERVDNIFGSKTFFTDRVVLRNRANAFNDDLKIGILSRGYRFASADNGREIDWEISTENRELELNIISHNPSKPLEISLSSKGLAKPIHIRPIDRASWRQWKPTGLEKVEYLWSGGNIFE